MLQRVKRFLAQGRRDRWLIARAFVWLGVLELGLRVLGFRRVTQRPWLPALVERPVSAEDLGRARRYAWAISVAGRHHAVRARCLLLSLTLHHWLRREELPSRLRIGVRKDGGALLAHAWVELAGQVVNDTAASVAAFAPLTRAAEPDGVLASGWLAETRWQPVP
jgi:hypothetical protein